MGLLRSPGQPSAAPSRTTCPRGLVLTSALQAWGGHLALSQAFPAPMCPGLGSVPRTRRDSWAEGRGGAGRARAQSCGLSPGPSVTQTPPGHLTVGWSLYAGQGHNPLDFEVSHRVCPRGEALGRPQPHMQRVGNSQGEAPRVCPQRSTGRPERGHRARSRSRAAGRQVWQGGRRSGATHVCWGPGMAQGRDRRAPGGGPRPVSARARRFVPGFILPSGGHEGRFFTWCSPRQQNKDANKPSDPAPGASRHPPCTRGFEF